jgi:hypothetical protein
MLISSRSASRWESGRQATLPRKWHELYAFDVDGRAQDGHVAAAVVEACGRLGEVELVERHLDVGKLLREGAAHGRYEVDGSPDGEADAQPAAPTFCRLLSTLEQAVELGEHLDRVVAQRFTFRGQRDPPRRAVDEPQAGLGLELLERLRQRGLGEVEPLRCAREVQLLGEHDEGAQMAEAQFR